ncbi:unnamed protein product [Coregonus sp. 'balchen']|nr:unnamed protein product [Coregonus sp. 'balchen']
MLTSPVDDSNILFHLLNYSTFCLCLVSKVPSIVLVARAKSSKGFSLKGLLLELTGYVVFVTYQIHHAAPSSTFLEYPILIAQGGWKLVTLQDWIIDLAMCLYQSKDSSGRRHSSAGGGLNTFQRGRVHASQLDGRW